MSTTTKMVIGALAAALVVGGICLVVFGIPSLDDRAADDEGSENEAAEDTSWSYVEADDKSTETGRVKAENISGLDKTSLNEAEVARLEEYLTKRFGENGANMDDARFSIEEKESDEAGYKRFRLVNERSGKDYVLLVGDVWTLEAGYKDPEKVEQPAQTTPPASTNTSTAQNPAGETDQTSELNSSVAMRNFDTRTAVALSKKDSVNPLIGEAVSSRLLSDINAYIAPSGSKISQELDVVVSPSTVNTQGNVLRFTCMAYCGNDHMVFNCTYDVKSLKHSIVWQS